MFARRGFSSATIFVFIGALLLLGYSYFKVNNLADKLLQKRKEIDVMEQHERALKDQLKVIFKHSEKIEDVLKKERQSNKDLRSEFSKNIALYTRNLSESQHEAMNRFNALDTDYKMLKASNEELNQNFNALQQNHVRLSEEHRNLDSQSKRDLKSLSDAKESESVSLQGRIQDLYNQKVSLQNQVASLQTSENNIRTKLQETLEVAQQYQSAVKKYQTLVKNSQVELENCQKKKQKAHFKKEDVVDTDDLKVAALKLSKLENHDLQNVTVTAETKDHETGVVNNRLLVGENVDYGNLGKEGTSDSDIIDGDNNLAKQTEQEDKNNIQETVEPHIPNRYSINETLNENHKNTALNNQDGDVNMENEKQNVDTNLTDVKHVFHNERYKNTALNINKNSNEDVHKLDETVGNNDNNEEALRPDLSAKKFDNPEFHAVADEKNYHNDKHEGLYGDINDEIPNNNNEGVDIKRGVGVENDQYDIKPIKANKIKFESNNEGESDKHYDESKSNQLKPHVASDVLNNDKETDDRAMEPPRNQMPIPKRVKRQPDNEVDANHKQDNQPRKQMPIPKQGVRRDENQNIIDDPNKEDVDGNDENLHGEEELHHENERMNVEKVTLEDDEKGDQMLDQNKERGKEHVNGNNMNNNKDNNGGEQEEEEQEEEEVEEGQASELVVVNKNAEEEYDYQWLFDFCYNSSRNRTIIGNHTRLLCSILLFFLSILTIFQVYSDT